MAEDFCVFKLLRRSGDGKHLMHFQSESFLFKYLRCSVDEVKALISLRFLLILSF